MQYYNLSWIILTLSKTHIDSEVQGLFEGNMGYCVRKNRSRLLNRDD